MWRVVRLLPVVIALAGCAQGESSADDLRQAWLTDALVDDNLVWLSRDHALLQAKYAAMAADPYDYMRGTAGVFLRDQARPGTARAPTAFLTAPETTAVLIVGDPHPENVGTLRPGEGPGPTDAAPVLLLEVNDLDGASFGPYTIDVRRALLGLQTLLVAASCSADCRGSVSGAWVEAYVDELAAISTGAPTWRPGVILGQHGAALDLLLSDAITEGTSRERRGETTEVTPDGRRFRLDAALDPLGNGILGLTPAERAQADRLLDAVPGPPGFRVLDVARRYGSGIASMPAIRYVVAWDRGDPGPDDDELLQLREVVDPPAMPGIHAPAPAWFDTGGDRVVHASHLLWSRPEADVRLAAVPDGAATFKVLTWSSFHAPHRHDVLVREIDNGGLTLDDLRTWADVLGRQLAAVHGRSVTASGAPALGVLMDDLSGRQDAFVAERVRDAEADVDALLRDHALFNAALQDHGPLLGAERLR